MPHDSIFTRGGGACAVLASLLLWAVPASGADSDEGNGAYSATELKEPPPEGVSTEVRKLLGERAIRVGQGDSRPFADLWLLAKIEPREDPGKLGVDYGFLDQGSLLGVIRFHRRSRDFRGKRFKAGTYTLRYLLLPEDGDHLGVAESRDFVLLCPIAEDTAPEPLPEKRIIELSTKVSGTKHPSVLYLLKRFDEPPAAPRMVAEEDLDYWILDCQHPAEGGNPRRLSLVLIGESPEA